MGTILRCSKRTSFLRILTQIELLLQFRAHFADLVFQLFNILKCKSSSRHTAAHFLSIPFPHRGPNLRKQTPHCSALMDSLTNTYQKYSKILCQQIQFHETKCLWRRPNACCDTPIVIIVFSFLSYKAGSRGRTNNYCCDTIIWDIE